MIICNGASKSGTHALLNALVLFGIGDDDIVHRHNPYHHKDKIVDKHTQWTVI